jgi:hypothetical protein
MFGPIFHLSWLRNGMIALLAMGLVFSLNGLDHSAIAIDLDLTNLDWINHQIIRPVLAQTASTPNSNVTTSAGAEPSRNFDWIKWWGIGFLVILVLGFISEWIDSWCPICKRFWVVKTTTRVLRHATEETQGEELVTRSCRCCSYTQERHQTIPTKTPESDVGCFGCM